ncbi:MAG TPA: PqqD family protein [Chloroflexia bacterium]|nr:PqqD family protein [Chloroflexia bacterium]
MVPDRGKHMPPAATQSQTTWRPHPDVVAQRMGDRVVLVHLRNNRIYELNRTGARYWELLAGGSSPQAIHSQLAAEFAVDSVTLAAEMDGLRNALAAGGLLTRAAD